MQSAFKAPRISVAGLVLLGLALRWVPLTRDPLHQDEALYGFWGRLISTGRDPWLATVPADKPPLALYLIAGSQSAFGVSEFTTRLPGLAAGLLAIPLIYALARRLYGTHGAGLVAAAVMALTPYPVLFGATAFTDPILIAAWLAACYAAVRGRWGWAGLMSGLAMATKQHAVLLVPLAVGLGLTQFPWRGVRGWMTWRAKGMLGRNRSAWGPGARFMLGAGSLVVIVLVWDALRVANGATRGFWAQGVGSYGGLRLIRPGELLPRFEGWAQLGGYLLGWPWLGVLLSVGVGLLLWRDLTDRRRSRPALVDLTLITFSVFYCFLHWLVAFPVWDRYLMPLAPVMALLLGRLVSLVSAQRPAPNTNGQALRNISRFTLHASRITFHVLRFTLYALPIVLLLSTGLLAAFGRIPVGGDHGAYDGLGEVVDFLRALPVGTVLYDRWLSWHYDFYLFDAYLYRAGFPSPGWLAADAAALYDGQPRYLVVPSWESSARLKRALSEVGLDTSPVLTTRRRDGTRSFVVYEIRQ